MNDRPLFFSGCPRDFGDLAEHLTALARRSASLAKKRRRPPIVARHWRCLRAGPDTPLWNAVARAAAMRLRRRGAKVRLARLLGISRQRLHLLLVAKRAYPDAERALQLLCWLRFESPRRRQARSAPPRPNRLSSIK